MGNPFREIQVLFVVIPLYVFNVSEKFPFSVLILSNFCCCLFCFRFARTLPEKLIELLWRYSFDLVSSMYIFANLHKTKTRSKNTKSKTNDRKKNHSNIQYILHIRSRNEYQNDVEKRKFEIKSKKKMKKKSCHKVKSHTIWNWPKNDIYLKVTFFFIFMT